MKQQNKNTLQYVWIALLLVSTATGAQTLNGRSIGDAAPPLSIAKWLAGEPIERFQPGRYYLVEFTHRLCKACVEGIPTLTELAKEYKNQLTVVSIYSYWPKDSYTPEAYEAAIGKLMADLGERMEFTVAMDEPQATTNTAWRGSGPTGFPFTFLVDGTGNVAWWGSGATGLTDIQQQLPGILSGQVDPRDALAYREAYVSAYSEASQQRPAAAIRRVDSLMTVYPKERLPLANLKFHMLLRLDQPTAGEYLAGLLDRHPDFTFDPQDAFEPGQYPHLDWRLALEIYDRQAEQAVTDGSKGYWTMLKSKHYAIYHQYPEAKAAIELAMALKAGNPPDTTAIPDSYRDFHRAYAWQLQRAADERAAKRWLRRAMASGKLSKITAGWLANRSNDGLMPKEIRRLKAYAQQGGER